MSERAKAVIFGMFMAAIMDSKPFGEQIKIKNKLDATKQKIADDKALRKAEEKRRRKRKRQKKEATRFLGG